MQPQLQSAMLLCNHDQPCGVTASSSKMTMAHIMPHTTNEMVYVCSHGMKDVSPARTAATARTAERDHFEAHGASRPVGSSQSTSMAAEQRR